MAIDRQGTALAILRICIGVFFIFEGVNKIAWLTNASLLGNQLDGWLRSVPPTSFSHSYLVRVAIPGTAVFARLVPLGEMSSGIALVLGAWTPLFALVAFFMAFNFQFASGVMFKYAFLTSGYGLPVLGSTLALVVGGGRRPWSIRRARPARAMRAPRS
jgi:uncharacterized membrane protein YphA (DoxX/SURF4 family)